MKRLFAIMILTVMLCYLFSACKEQAVGSPSEQTEAVGDACGIESETEQETTNSAEAPKETETVIVPTEPEDAPVGNEQEPNPTEDSSDDLGEF